MDKKRIYVERFGRDDRPPFPRHEEHERHHFRGPRPPRKTTTKLITSKEELVQYVNELGAKGHMIDIFKIEDGLYKVVVQERGFPGFPPEAEEIEIEIE